MLERMLVDTLWKCIAISTGTAIYRGTVLRNMQVTSYQMDQPKSDTCWIQSSVKIRISGQELLISIANRL